MNIIVDGDAMRLAVIPARGGSKRIPMKNIRDFAGKPMIAHAIEAALASEMFDKVVVSTDSGDIAEVARKYGAEVPFMRPVDLADDHTPTVPVIAHALKVCAELGWQVSYACCIYPGVPFLRTADLVQAFELLQNKDAPYAFPVTEFPSAIQRALRRLPDGRMAPCNPEFELTRTQDLERAYHDAGQFYWGRSEAWTSNLRLHAMGVGLVIPSWRVVDIDTPEDWERAEILFTAFGQTGVK